MVLMLLVALVFAMQNGLFQSVEATQFPSEESGQTPQSLISTTTEAVLLPVGGTPSAGVIWQTTPLVTYKETKPVVTVTLTSEAVVDVIAPQAPYPLVTEFYDAYEVVMPSVSETSKPSSNKTPALVTGFTGTLPLSLPLASPNVNEEEMRAVYVASAYNLDFPSKPGLSKNELQKELDEIVNNALACGMNTIFFQVRPASDALYRSSLFPTSRYLAESEGGALALDALGYLIEKAHAKGVKVHAWINPFRVRSASESDAVLSKTNPAKIDPNLTFTVEGAVYYNPALVAVQDLVLQGVREILTHYDVDGILFDDYFYPENMKSEDAASYAAYLKSGGTLSLGDFRRQNINLLIERVYRTVKSEKKNCLFGVAPRGVWRNASEDPLGSNTRGGSAYDAIFCDALAWVKGGYLDYLSPQIYWSFDHKSAPFATLADWWDNALSDSGVKLCVSLAVYSLSDAEIERQKEYLAKLEEYDGFALYRYRYLT